MIDTGRGAHAIVKTRIRLCRFDLRRTQCAARFKPIGYAADPGIINTPFSVFVVGTAGDGFRVSHSSRSISPGGA